MTQRSVVEKKCCAARFARLAGVLSLPLFAAAFAMPIPAIAQTFPSRPVHIVVPYVSGAAADAIARIVAEGLAAQWGYPVLVDNRPGGSSIPGTELVMRAAPDGHTLLLTTNDTFTVVPHLFPARRFEPLKDLAPVNIPARIPMLMVVNGASQVNSLEELIARARAKPGGMSYGSYGSGGSVHLAMETLKFFAKIDILHVPYKGVAPTIAAAAAGDVQVAMTGYVTARGLLEAGRLRPIAIASPERLAQLPNIPTMRELGYAEVDATVWWCIAAPAKTPTEIVNRLSAAISRVSANPGSRKLMEARGFVVTDIGPKAFAEQIAREYRVRGDEVRRAGVKVD